MSTSPSHAYRSPLNTAPAESQLSQTPTLMELNTSGPPPDLLRYNLDTSIVEQQMRSYMQQRRGRESPGEASPAPAPALPLPVPMPPFLMEERRQSAKSTKLWGTPVVPREDTPASMSPNPYFTWDRKSGSSKAGARTELWTFPRPSPTSSTTSGSAYSSPRQYISSPIDFPVPGLLTEGSPGVRAGSPALPKSRGIETTAEKKIQFAGRTSPYSQTSMGGSTSSLLSPSSLYRPGQLGGETRRSVSMDAAEWRAIQKSAIGQPILVQDSSGSLDSYRPIPPAKDNVYSHSRENSRGEFILPQEPVVTRGSPGTLNQSKARPVPPGPSGKVRKGFTSEKKEKETKTEKIKSVFGLFPSGSSKESKDTISLSDGKSESEKRKGIATLFLRKPEKQSSLAPSPAPSLSSAIPSAISTLPVFDNSPSLSLGAPSPRPFPWISPRSQAFPTRSPKQKPLTPATILRTSQPIPRLNTSGSSSIRGDSNPTRNVSPEQFKGSYFREPSSNLALPLAHPITKEQNSSLNAASENTQKVSARTSSKVDSARIIQARVRDNAASRTPRTPTTHGMSYARRASRSRSIKLRVSKRSRISRQKAKNYRRSKNRSRLSPPLNKEAYREKELPPKPDEDEDWVDGESINSIEPLQPVAYRPESIASTVSQVSTLKLVADRPDSTISAISELDDVPSTLFTGSVLQPVFYSPSITPTPPFPKASKREPAPSLSFGTEPLPAISMTVTTPRRLSSRVNHRLSVTIPEIGRKVSKSSSTRTPKTTSRISGSEQRYKLSLNLSEAGFGDFDLDSSFERQLEEEEDILGWLENLRLDPKKAVIAKTYPPSTDVEISNAPDQEKPIIDSPGKNNGAKADEGMKPLGGNVTSSSLSQPTPGRVDSAALNADFHSTQTPIKPFAKITSSSPAVANHDIEDYSKTSIVSSSVDDVESKQDCKSTSPESPNSWTTALTLDGINISWRDAISSSSSSFSSSTSSTSFYSPSVYSSPTLQHIQSPTLSPKSTPKTFEIDSFASTPTTLPNFAIPTPRSAGLRKSDISALMAISVAASLHQEVNGIGDAVPWEVYGYGYLDGITASSGLLPGEIEAILAAQQREEQEEKRAKESAVELEGELGKNPMAENLGLMEEKIINLKRSLKRNKNSNRKRRMRYVKARNSEVEGEILFVMRSEDMI